MAVELRGGERKKHKPMVTLCPLLLSVIFLSSSNETGGGRGKREREARNLEKHIQGGPCQESEKAKHEEEEKKKVLSIYTEKGGWG